MTIAKCYGGWLSDYVRLSLTLVASVPSTTIARIRAGSGERCRPGRGRARRR